MSLCADGSAYIWGQAIRKRGSSPPQALSELAASLQAGGPATIAKPHPPKAWPSRGGRGQARDEEAHSLQGQQRGAAREPQDPRAFPGLCPSGHIRRELRPQGVQRREGWCPGGSRQGRGQSCSRTHQRTAGEAQSAAVQSTARSLAATLQGSPMPVTSSPSVGFYKGPAA